MNKTFAVVIGRAVNGNIIWTATCTVEAAEPTGGIIVSEYTTDKIRIETTDDSSVVPVWKDVTTDFDSLNAAVNTSENDLDLTQHFKDAGWKGMRLLTNGISRHKIQAQVKCYIESK